MNWGWKKKNKRKKEKIQRSKEVSIPDHNCTEETLPIMFSDISIPLSHHTVLMALGSLAECCGIQQNIFCFLLPYLIKDFIFFLWVKGGYFQSE